MRRDGRVHSSDRETPAPAVVQVRLLKQRISVMSVIFRCSRRRHTYACYVRRRTYAKYLCHSSGASVMADSAGGGRAVPPILLHNRVRQSLVRFNENPV